jgi:hypothetical protein
MKASMDLRAAVKDDKEKNKEKETYGYTNNYRND